MSNEVLFWGFEGLATIAVAAILLFPDLKRRRRSSRQTSGYTPRGDRVIVKRLERPAQQPGEVFVPDSQQKPLNEGTVISVGPEVDDIEPGCIVCFVEYAGTEVEVDGQSYLSMREQEIHGVRRG